MKEERTYTIREVSRLSGLPASTLRYYESIGIIQPIARGVSSKQRVYTQADVDAIDPLACLSATGMPLDDMRSYVANMSKGKDGADNQIALLRAQAAQLKAEAKKVALREQYVALKVRYWQAVAAGHNEEAGSIGNAARSLSHELKYAKE